jgi:hypothetical protein
VITLVKVELTRLRWRRAVIGLLVLAVLVPAATFTIRFVDTRPQSIESLTSDYGSYVVDEVERCVNRRGADSQETCEKRIAAQFGNDLDIREEREEGGALAVLLLVGLLMLLVGTTFAGHDWNTGSMSNQLLFEPRRARVWAAKAVAVALLASAVTLVVSAAYWSGIWTTVAVRDLPIPNHAVAAGYKQVVLAAVFAAACAVFGYALTMLLRSTVATMGLLFAVMFLAVVTTGLFGFDSGLERFMPWGNFYAYAVGSYEYFADLGPCLGRGLDGGCTSDAHHITRAASLLYFGLVLAAVSVPSLLSFRQRDLP